MSLMMMITVMLLLLLLVSHRSVHLASTSDSPGDAERFEFDVHYPEVAMFLFTGH